MHRLPLLLVAAALSLARPLTAAGLEGGWSFTVRAENDLPANSDRYYTNGASILFSHCIDDRDMRWPGILALPGLSEWGVLGQVHDLGQIIVTPADTQRSLPDPRDRPYAGLLYAGIGWQRWWHDDYAGFKLITGVVGPPALARQMQTAVHRLIDSPLPRGWRHQLATEPILNAVYERRRRVLAWGDPLTANGDLLVASGAMLGNVLTQAHAQIQVRHGWRVPADFGSSLIRGIGALPPPRQNGLWGLHAFASAGGLAVARNLTLDGNSFRSGPRVKRRPWISTHEIGVAVRGHGWQLTTSWVSWAREFEGQPRASRFGTVAFSVFR
jgi:lipid A 3-O-deacylase